MLKGVKMIKDFSISIFIYIFVILFPILIYLKKKGENILTYLKLNTNSKKGIFMGIAISIVYIIMVIVKNYKNNFANLNFNIGIMWISGILVGFLEEVPLRGFLLNKLQDKFSFWTANIIVTVIFVCCHFPKWILINADIVNSAVRISFVSLIYGYLVKRFDSLWTVIICHSVFDLCFFIGL